MYRDLLTKDNVRDDVKPHFEHLQNARDDDIEIPSSTTSENRLTFVIFVIYMLKHSAISTSFETILRSSINVIFSLIGFLFVNKCFTVI